MKYTVTPRRLYVESFAEKLLPCKVAYQITDEVGEVVGEFVCDTTPKGSLRLKNQSVKDKSLLQAIRKGCKEALQKNLAYGQWKSAQIFDGKYTWQIEDILATSIKGHFALKIPVHFSDGICFANQMKELAKVKGYFNYNKKDEKGNYGRYDFADSNEFWLELRLACTCDSLTRAFSQVNSIPTRYYIFFEGEHSNLMLAKLGGSSLEISNDAAYKSYDDGNSLEENKELFEQRIKELLEKYYVSQFAEAFAKSDLDSFTVEA